MSQIVATFVAGYLTNRINEARSVIAMAPTTALSRKALPSVLLLVVSLVTLGGCIHVRPYQRERLTHSTMTTADWGGPGEAHARAVREGATGGGSAGEAGCGCN